MKWLSLSLCCFILAISNAQDCQGTYNPYYFNVNKVKTGFIPLGEKFVAGENGGSYQVPFPEFQSASTLSSGAAWIASHIDGQLRVAAHQYSLHQTDFRMGPLDPLGMTYTSICDQFDRAWSVFREDILRHQLDFIVDGMIDDPIPSVYGWPAVGNDFFQTYHGFALPSDHAGGFADFFDKNLNGKYEPDLGEYPVVYLKGELTVPDQIMWMVYNDQGPHLHSHSDPLGVELQLIIYGYYCEDNTLLNHSLFATYKVINQTTAPLDSVYFGLFNDYEIGCSGYDDYIGSDSVRQVEFAYNSLPVDGDQFCNKGYGQYPPIQSMTYLSHPIYSFIDEPLAYSDVEFFRLLTGRHRNGKPIYTGGNGIDSLSGSRKTKFLFNGNPNDPEAWSAIAVAVPPANRRTVSSVFLGKVEAKEPVRIETVYSFHRDSIHLHLDLFDVMYADVDAMHAMTNDIHSACTAFPFCLDGDCVWPGDFNHDGIADHRDGLYWSVMKGKDGGVRNGLVSWRGHFAEDWLGETPDGLNYKHSDANGNGHVDGDDLWFNHTYHHFTDPNVVQTDRFPQGPHLRITGEPMNEDGDMDNIEVMTGIDLPALYGLAFELVYDTIFFGPSHLIIQYYPEDTTGLYYDDGFFQWNNGDYFPSLTFAFVSTGGENFSLPAGTRLLRIPFGIINKYQLPLAYLPDTVHVRLKNLVGIDKEGRDLQLGSYDLHIPNALLTSAADVVQSGIEVYPNPASNHLSIVCPQSDELALYNSLGQLIKTGIINTAFSSIDISSLTPGVYYLQFGKSPTAIRVIKI